MEESAKKGQREEAWSCVQTLLESSLHQVNQKKLLFKT